MGSCDSFSPLNSSTIIFPTFCSLDTFFFHYVGHKSCLHICVVSLNWSRYLYLNNGLLLTYL
ncbi:unnamed protein product [Brassica napus]|uniref:(rape) hypothetical protein n=1 Tax=Brassica napus TaxID=3708 RepID=A0A816VGW7_BRANA|nr:unnamed protein product [Brassica napus]